MKIAYVIIFEDNAVESLQHSIENNPFLQSFLLTANTRMRNIGFTLNC